MPRSSRSTSKKLALLVGLAAGVTLGATTFAAPSSDDGLQSVTGSLTQGMTGSNARGMTGSNARGMTGSNARGMTGSNARGMTGSNARGMTGSNARGMTGSNARGMTGSNARGMTGSNARGMTGSNARGMTGSNARGMTGSNARGMTGSNARGITVTNASRFGNGFDVAAMGPLQAISVKNGVGRLVVAGQVFGVPAEDALSFSVGDYIVAGAASGDMAVVYHAGAPYIAGVSTVRVKAAVDAVDPTIGKLTVAGLTVDYTAQLTANPGLAPAIGDLVEASGIQPVPGAALLVGFSGTGLAISPDAANSGRQ